LLTTWVYYRARDWPQALEAARAGLALDPRQPWLLERSAAAALSLRDGAQAARFAAELERSAACSAGLARARALDRRRARARRGRAGLIALREDADRRRLARAPSWRSPCSAACAVALCAFARPRRA
jgi:hypothetical protein